jgi:16S rRNA (guanine527-N7)-methyltransferase
MTKSEYTNYIIEAFVSNGIGHMIDEEKANKFYELYCFLVEYNKMTNLTAITDEKEVILKHFIDCSAITEHLPQNASVIDVGCGAGFPSLPIAIVRPDVTVMSLDSTGKKIEFVNKAIELLGLERSTAVCARAEDYVVSNREAYDVCVSRAVARLNILAELCLPLVKIGGLFVAMKSNKGSEELSEAVRCISVLGAKHVSTKTDAFALQGLDNIERETQIFSKVTSTPKQYPRKYSQILKKPL